ncbi:UTP--glucose-1-phosphate uridylyltransferase [Paenibacillus baekrokdamisoli]|uniref:UTP--glucose-1-phosphate uridylyltransferase n=1 Tax=Paenibacillus baekrokdamisoli TaxID=1712516 RepID=A0A3G9IV85_9BACL|nr:UTP--glucose-1-phosphate uridylyltransferase GalU [Paenibacillus baekrokdamisoli]MBB3068247.1 UTP--glucose-1-phosphate uridylyltransferase [Paenibacillus baekrokdamisoli]BBH22710.1 UTP--glucose-1-phosphate uridylyltransferase [Paenibacillus baekrokdamisoli]
MTGKVVRKAIIPAGGLGTRFLPATKAQPKEMLPLIDKPAIQYIVEEAVASGIESIMIVTGRNKRAIEDHFDKSVELEYELESHGKSEMLELVQKISHMADICYIRQREPLGLGHAVLSARSFVENEPFAVLLGDDILLSEPPCLKQMIDLYEAKRSSVVAVMEVPWDQTHKYGIVALEKGDMTGRVSSLIEKPAPGEAPSNLAVVGRYLLEPSIFDYLEKATPGKGGEIQLTDSLQRLNIQSPLQAFQFQGRRYDVGDKLGFVQATIDLALEREDLGRDVREYLLKRLGIADGRG